MVKGKTPSGISYKVNESVVNDIRTVYFIRQMQSEKSTDEEKEDAIFNLLKFVFGGEQGMLAFMDAVAKANGDCAPETLIKEVKEIFAAINAKNSSSSHT